MEISAVASAPSCNALGEHFENRFESLARKIAVRICTPHQGEELIFIPGFRRSAGVLALRRIREGHSSACGARGNDLLGENIQRRIRYHQPVQLAVADGTYQGGAFQKLIASGDKESP